LNQYINNKFWKNKNTQSCECIVKAFGVGKTPTKEGMLDDLADGWYETIS